MNWRHTDFQSVALPTELPRHRPNILAHTPPPSNRIDPLLCYNRLARIMVSPHPKEHSLTKSLNVASLAAGQGKTSIIATLTRHFQSKGKTVDCSAPDSL